MSERERKSDRKRKQKKKERQRKKDKRKNKPTIVGGIAHERQTRVFNSGAAG